MQPEILIRELCPTSSRQLIKKGAVLLDIREPELTDAIQFDVPNIIYLPLSQLTGRHHELPKDKDLIVVCERGILSLDAAAYLQEQGFDRIYHMRKGLNHWAAKGYPVSGDTSHITVHKHACCGKHGHHHHPPHHD